MSETGQGFRSMEEEVLAGIQMDPSWKGGKEAAQRVYDLLEDKLAEISFDIYNHESDPTTSGRFKRLDSAWTAYLEGLNLKRDSVPTQNGLPCRVAGDYRRCEVWPGHYKISDPLYVAGGFIEFPKELALKILTLGCLP